VAVDNEKPEQPKSAAAPSQKEDAQDFLKVFKERLGIERSIRDEAKYSIQNLEKQLQTIQKQNAKLESQNRDTINIKTINSEILRNKQDLYVTTAKIADKEKEVLKGDPKKIEAFKQQMQEHEKLKKAEKKAEDELRESAIKVESEKKKLGAAGAAQAEKTFSKQKQLTQDLAFAESEAKRKIELADQNRTKDIEATEKEMASKKTDLQKKVHQDGVKLASLDRLLDNKNLSEQKREKLERQKYEIESNKKQSENELSLIDETKKKRLDAFEAIRAREVEDAQSTLQTTQKNIAEEQKLLQENLTDGEKAYQQSLETMDAKQQQLDIAKDQSQLNLDSMDEEALTLAALQKQKDVEEAQLAINEKRKQQEVEVSDTLGLTGTLAQKFTEKLGVGEGVYNAMTEKARQLVEEQEKSGKKMGLLSSRWEVLKAGIKAAGQNLRDMWNDPVARAAILAGILKTAWNGLRAGFDKVGAAAAGAGNMLKKMSSDSASVFSDLAKPALDIVSKIPMVGGLISGVLSGIIAVVDMVTGMNDALIKTGRTLGMTYEQTKALNHQFQNFSASSGDIFNNSKKLLESYGEISKELGVITTLSNQDLTTNIKLRDLAGLDVQTRTKLMTIAKTSGKDVQTLTSNILAQTTALQKQTGIQLNNQKVLAEVTKLSGVLGLQFSKFPEKITAAYVQMKALGMELTSLDQKADGFLNFQDSIQKEFEAQLLTGKDLNLMKVRELMLNNKIADAGLLIAKQVGSSKDFLKMNRLEAQSYAAAMEMTRDEVANMLRDQEAMAAFGANSTKEVQKQVELLRQQGKEHEAIAKLGSREAYDAMTKATLQEKIAAFIEKIKQSLADFVERTGLIEKIEKMFKWLEDPSKIRGVIFAVRDAFAGIVDIMMSVVGGIMTALSKWPFNAVSSDELFKFRDMQKSISKNIRSVGTEALQDAGQEQKGKDPNKKEFALGGYTGDGPKNKIAGLVHAQEYVVNADQLEKLGGVVNFQKTLSELLMLKGKQEFEKSEKLTQTSIIPQGDKAADRSVQPTTQSIQRVPQQTPVQMPADATLKIGEILAKATNQNNQPKVDVSSIGEIVKTALEGVKTAIANNNGRMPEVVINLDGAPLAKATGDNFQKRGFSSTSTSPLFLQGV